MEIQFLRLLFDYSTNHKLVDNAYIEKLIEMVVNSKSLGNYIKSFSMSQEEQKFGDNDNVLASYSSINNTITVYPNMIQQALEGQERYHVLFHEVEQLFFQNLTISQIILHELEHANQKKIIDQEETLEAKILKLSSKELEELNVTVCTDKETIMHMISQLIVRSNNYKKNYDLSPNERLAHIKSYQEILDTLSNIKEYVPNLIEFEQTNKLESLIRGFRYESGFLKCPTISYISENGNVDQLKSFTWYDENYFKCLDKLKLSYSLEGRLTYGLMIEDDEFDCCRKKLLISKKYNC